MNLRAGFLDLDGLLCTDMIFDCNFRVDFTSLRNDYKILSTQFEL